MFCERCGVQPRSQQPATKLALPDIIEHDKIGLIVKSGDVEQPASALGRLIKDPNLGRRLGEDGKALHKARLDIKICAERLVAIWTESVHAWER